MPNYRMERGSIQHQFNLMRDKMQIMGGGFGNGKTTALVIKALQLVKDYPGSNGLLARETYPKLNDTLRKEFFKWCPADWIKKRPTQEDNTCYMMNGTTVNFRYIAQRGKQQADGTTTSNLLSATYDWIGVDQVEDPGIVHKDILDLMGRLRGSTPYRPTGEEDPSMPSTGPRWLMLTANPSPNWFYKEIVQPLILWRKYGTNNGKLLIDEETGVPIVNLVEGSTYTNSANLAPDYIKGLESAYKGQMKDRFLLGKWAAYEGLVYDTWDRAKNMIPREKMIEHLIYCVKTGVRIRCLEAYDFGLTSPSAYCIGFVDDYGRVFILDGYYQPNFHYTLQPAKIDSIRWQYYAYKLVADEPIEADPAIFKKIVVAGLKDTGTTIAKIYKDDYDLQMRPASNDIIQGIAKVTGYINGNAQVPHVLTGEKPGTLLYVADDLHWIDDEFTNYYWKKNPLGVNEDTPMEHQQDHAMDMIKYLLSHCPEPSQIVIPDHAQIPKWMFWHEVEE